MEERSRESQQSSADSQSSPPTPPPDPAPHTAALWDWGATLNHIKHYLCVFQRSNESTLCSADILVVFYKELNSTKNSIRVCAFKPQFKIKTV